MSLHFVAAMSSGKQGRYVLFYLQATASQEKSLVSLIKEKGPNNRAFWAASPDLELVILVA